MQRWKEGEGRGGGGEGRVILTSRVHCKVVQTGGRSDCDYPEGQGLRKAALRFHLKNHTAWVEVLMNMAEWEQSDLIDTQL